MLRRRYWAGVALTIPSGILLGALAGRAVDALHTGWGSPGAFVVPGAILGAGTALGAMVGALIATRRTGRYAPARHLLAVTCGAAIGAAGFWMVVTLAALVFTGPYLVELLIALAVVGGVASGVLTLAAVGVADLAAAVGRRLSH